MKKILLTLLVCLMFVPLLQSQVVKPDQITDDPCTIIVWSWKTQWTPLGTIVYLGFDEVEIDCND